MRASTANEITVNDNLTITGDLVVNGTNNINPFWVAGKVNGATLATNVSSGRSSFSVSRATGQPTGVYKISWTTPLPSAHYVITVDQQASGNVKVWDATPPTTTNFHIVTYGISWQVIDCVFYFAVLG